MHFPWFVVELARQVPPFSHVTSQHGWISVTKKRCFSIISFFNHFHVFKNYVMWSAKKFLHQIKAPHLGKSPTSCRPVHSVARSQHKQTYSAKQHQYQPTIPLPWKQNLMHFFQHLNDENFCIVVTGLGLRGKAVGEMNRWLGSSVVVSAQYAGDPGVKSQSSHDFPLLHTTLHVPRLTNLS